MIKKIIFAAMVLLTGCATISPPQQVNDVCRIFNQYPDWYHAARDVERRWLLPIHVQMAIIHQESKFQSDARPPVQYFLGFIPLGRPSSALGYAQALDSTWDLYRQSNGGWFSSRKNFKDAVDFIGWYANGAHRRAGIQRNDAYHLYLAYHEGVTGYLNRSYLKKAWLIPVAHKVSARAKLYQAQMKYCRITRFY
jgi:hypothetical protein